MTCSFASHETLHEATTTFIGLQTGGDASLISMWLNEYNHNYFYEQPLRQCPGWRWCKIWWQSLLQLTFQIYRPEPNHLRIKDPQSALYLTNHGGHDNHQRKASLRTMRKIVVNSWLHLIYNDSNTRTINLNRLWCVWLSILTVRYSKYDASAQGC